MYGRSITDADALTLSEAMHQRSLSYITNNRGSAAICVPFATVVPEGYTAYIVREITSSSVMLFPVAEGGEVLPHGAAVILQGSEAKASFTLTPAPPELIERAVSVEGNLLVGTFASKELKEGQGYYLSSSGTTFLRVSTLRTQEPFSCWLPCDSKRNTLSIDVTTPIRPIQNTNQKSFTQSYNVSGHPFTGNYQGIVIRNGKKEVQRLH